MPKPTYTAVAAISMDGYIAPLGKPGSGWTSPEDKQFLHETLDTADVIIVGRTTYDIARKPLSKRNCIILTRKVQTTKRTGRLEFYLNPKNVDLDQTIKQLGYKRVIILGGAQTYTYCLEKKLLNEIYLTIEPVIFGAGLRMFLPDRKLNPNLSLKQLKSLSRRTILIKCKVLY